MGSSKTNFGGNVSLLAEGTSINSSNNYNIPF